MFTLTLSPCALITILQGLTQAVVSNQEGINCLMDQGQKMRTVGATAMNETSSRSHSIFTIVVEINDVDEAGKDHIRVGKASSQIAQTKRNELPPLPQPQSSLMTCKAPKIGSE